MALRPARPDAGPFRIYGSMNFMAFVGRRLTLIATVFALGGACTASQDVRFDHDGGASGNTGAAGEDPSGTGGTGAGTGQGTAGEGAASGSAGAGAAGIVGGSGGASTGTAGAGGRGGATGTAGAHGDAGAGSAGASGSAGAAGDGAVQYSYATDIDPLLRFRCGGCHFETEIQGGFAVSYAGVTAHVSAANSGCPSLDASKLRVVPGKPQNSLIWIKTNINVVNPPGGCGGHMPNMALNLLPDQFQELQDWIAQGAKP
jgi:hypothetical protein